MIIGQTFVFAAIEIGNALCCIRINKGRSAIVGCDIVPAVPIPY
ncbi:hypothetical protein SAMN02927923_04345 [Microvirga guangxiensis]|uniref:Uncharacterized protein n=1 Tax=Microvirga guangxiensis TaxID=549386 RepID=A0A1G5LJP0_9HYPH|nr:hypothetical protein SAMN02927923_04345 [Microvirga guangxiensis]